MQIVAMLVGLAILVGLAWFVISEVRFWNANGRQIEDPKSRKARWRRKLRPFWIADLILIFWR